MEQARGLTPPAEEPIDYEAAVNETIREIDAILEQVHRDRQEIERLRAESRLLHRQTQEILDSLKRAA